MNAAVKGVSKQWCFLITSSMTMKMSSAHIQSFQLQSRLQHSYSLWKYAVIFLSMIYKEVKLWSNAPKNMKKLNILSLSFWLSPLLSCLQTTLKLLSRFCWSLSVKIWDKIKVFLSQTKTEVGEPTVNWAVYWYIIWYLLKSSVQIFVLL
jgi:hypothetical protein